MAGERIGAINSAMEQTLEEFREMNKENADVEIEIAVLEFSSGARWLTPSGPMKAENFFWNDLVASGRADMGEAFRILEEKLCNRSGFLQRASRYYCPIIFLISCAEPTDDYKTPLAELHRNNRFHESLKITLAIGDEANDHILEEFAGSKESVIRVFGSTNIGGMLTKMVQFIPYDDEYCSCRCSYCGSYYNGYSRHVHHCFPSEVHQVIPNNNVLWQALKRVRNEGGKDIFFSAGKFKSALADLLTGIGQDIIRLRKRTVEAVELGVYRRLKEAEQSDLERVVRVEIKRLHDEGISDTTAREIVYALAKFFVNDKQDQINDAIQVVADDNDWDIDVDDDRWDW